MLGQQILTPNGYFCLFTLCYLFHSKGILLRPFSKVTRRNGEPLRAVFISWFFVQVELCFRILVTECIKPSLPQTVACLQQEERVFSDELFFYTVLASILRTSLSCSPEHFPSKNDFFFQKC